MKEQLEKIVLEFSQEIGHRLFNSDMEMMQRAYELGKQESQWIKVEDGLPENINGDEYYLIMTTTCGIDMQLCMFNTDENNNPFITWTNYNNDQITDWQPLPKPPQL